MEGDYGPFVTYMDCLEEDVFFKRFDVFCLGRLVSYLGLRVIGIFGVFKVLFACMCVSVYVRVNVSLVEVSFTYSMNRRCKGMKETELREVQRKLIDALAEVDNILTLLEVPVDNCQLTLPTESKHASRKHTDTAVAGGKKKLFTTAFADNIRLLAFMSVTNLGVHERHMSRRLLFGSRSDTRSDTASVWDLDDVTDCFHHHTKLAEELDPAVVHPRAVDSFSFSLTMEVFRDPVIIADGQNERTEIEKIENWFTRGNRSVCRSDSICEDEVWVAR